jgi:hypothetical protein
VILLNREKSAQTETAFFGFGTSQLEAVVADGTPVCALANGLAATSKITVNAFFVRKCFP